MPEVRVVVRHTGRRGNFDLAIDGAACGPLPAAGERWLSVEPGPHSLFVNSKGFRKGVIKAFVAAPGADVCLWVASARITHDPHFTEPQPALPVPPATVSWYEWLVSPLVTAVL